ncbi:udp-n-acetylmuramoylalanyl-d-glutamate-2,6-diaminopimelate ligase [mine drainage metagenome]|uniref:Udp-n-acetylmuramoylalanyl-d-glutamate-2, 6-diaminopimelate ligase n=1 Tax=mine drainage metagenome TaxID=410659 RepID=T1B6X7_9ZZZZ
MRADALLDGLAEAGAVAAIAVRGLQLDSRRVQPGEAFVALRGTQRHGIDFAAQALAAGAALVLAEAPAPQAAPQLPQVIWVDDLGAQLGSIAARFYGDPSRALRVIGVTGTNGKTSSVQLLTQALELLGRRAASIGTLGAGLHGQLDAGARTTPDAISVQRLLREFSDAGASDVAMEVSSHALQQGRVNAVRFSVAAFTNLTRDHLDYHGSMQAYGAAKARLFAWPGLRAAVLNIDDAFGARLAATMAPDVRVLRVSAAGDAHADLRAEAIVSSPEGISFTLHTPWGSSALRSALLGRINVENLLLVAACLGVLEFPFARVLHVLQQLEPIRGRMNRLGGIGAQPLVVIDYAHTPDALQQALRALRAHCAGHLWCVFGCGGERDAGKRPQMGALAADLADRVLLTDDNPRGEDGDAIVAAIRAGMPASATVVIERDRARAIALALREARAGDVVLIAGKGHETYQESGGKARPFDDLALARAALEARPC